MESLVVLCVMPTAGDCVGMYSTIWQREQTDSPPKKKSKSRYAAQKETEDTEPEDRDQKEWGSTQAKRKPILK